MDKYDISIIVAIDNSFNLTNNFTEHLMTIINHTKVEIIFVLDGCKEFDTIKYLSGINSQHKNVIFHTLEDKQGYGIANNIAVDLSHGEYLLFINSDVFPKQGSIELLYKYLNTNESVKVVQGLLLYPQTNLVQSTGHIFGYLYNNHALEGRNRTDKIVLEEQQRQALTSAFYMMKRTTFYEYGKFDNFYYNAWEGMEFTLRITHSGKKCMYFPEAVAYHVRGGGRDFVDNNEDQQSAYFWVNWGNKVTEDLEMLLKTQIDNVILSRKYALLNCSSKRDVGKIIERLGIKDLSCTDLQDRYRKNINLYYNLIRTFISYPNELLFFCDSFSQIRGNRKWIEERQLYCKNDLVLDTCGNVIYLSELIQN